MKVYTASENEIDERLELDKRQEGNAFCLCFNSLKEAPEGFYDSQDKIRDGLEKELWTKFDDGVDRTGVKPWQAEAMHQWFYFDSDMFGSERIMVEIVHTLLSDKLIGVILAYLEKSAATYCVIVSVYHDRIKSGEYMGRMVINLKEVAVEESLVETWSKQIQFLEMEERN